MTTRITFKTAPPHLRDVEAWPRFDTSGLSAEDYAVFQRRSKALRFYLTTGNLKEACVTARCSRSTLLSTLTACLTLASDGKINGFRAIVPNTRIKEYVRTKKLPTGRVSLPSECTGAFKSLLEEHPRLHEALDRCIERGGSTSHSSRNPRSLDVFRTFKQLCKAYVGPNSYPLNSNSQGRRSVERYVRAYLSRHLECTETWFGASAAERLNIGTGHKSIGLGEAPFDVVAFDAHKIHCIGTIEIPGPAGLQRIPLERLWINVVLDSGCSNAALGYSVAISKEINALHVELAIKACTQFWRPLPLKNSHAIYKEGAGFPVGTIQGLTECRFAQITMDNAAQHFANRIVHNVRRAMGCTIRWGQVGAWWRNTDVERFFKTLEDGGFQRLPSSTGSNALDPLKGDPIGGAQANAITWQELVELADVYLANYNTTPQRALGGQTPLQVLAHHCSTESTTFIQRPSMPITAFAPKLGVSIENKVIRGSLKKGKRPYVEIDQACYTSDSFSKRFDLIRSTVLVHIDQTDMRCVEVFKEDGTPLGVLRPIDSTWRREKQIPRDIIVAINANIRNAYSSVDSSEPLNNLLEEMAQKTESKARRKNKISRSGTKLADFLYRSESELPSRKNDLRADHIAPLNLRSMPTTFPAPSWELDN